MKYVRINTPVTSDITIYCKDKGSTDPIVYDGYVTTYGALIWKYAPDTCTFTVERTPNFYYDDSFEEYLLEAKHLVVEDSVDAIGEAIMLNSEEIETVKIAGSVKSIGADCFQNCEKLRSVTLGEGIETIGSGSFSELPLVSEIKIPESVKTISDGAFLSNSDNFKLIGKAGSAAQTYAEENGIKFEVSEGTEPTETQPTTTEPITQPTTEKPTENGETKPTTATDPATTTEPVATTEPQVTTAPVTTAPAVIAKKANPVKVTVKTKTVKLKNLKKKAQTVKAITVKNAKGKVTYKLTSVPKKIKKLTKISSKGVITIKKWKKAKKGTYNFKVNITAAGNDAYKPKSVTMVVKIKNK